MWLHEPTKHVPLHRDFSLAPTGCASSCAGTCSGETSGVKSRPSPCQQWDLANMYPSPTEPLGEAWLNPKLTPAKKGPQLRYPQERQKGRCGGWRLEMPLAELCCLELAGKRNRETALPSPHVCSTSHPKNGGGGGDSFLQGHRPPRHILRSCLRSQSSWGILWQHLAACTVRLCFVLFLQCAT